MTGMGVPPLVDVVVEDGAELVCEGEPVDTGGAMVEDGELALTQDASLEERTVYKSELPPCRLRASIITKMTAVPL
jgi:hypothetical protein